MFRGSIDAPNDAEIECWGAHCAQSSRVSRRKGVVTYRCSEIEPCANRLFPRYGPNFARKLSAFSITFQSSAINATNTFRLRTGECFPVAEDRRAWSSPTLFAPLVFSREQASGANHELVDSRRRVGKSTRRLRHGDE